MMPFRAAYAGGWPRWWPTSGQPRTRIRTLNHVPDDVADGVMCAAASGRPCAWVAACDVFKFQMMHNRLAPAYCL